ncbi:trypsin-like peptidase domain-containing protein [Candidatus Woesearchaeota archaeon]|nr:trypsin-like peptidase domain-containing protein [Candidatus Woesearchaeota archaeon]
MTEKEVEDYIKVQRSLGVSASEIHKALINAGYTEEEFRHILETQAGRAHRTSKDINITPKHLVYLNLTVIIIFVGALFYMNYDYRSKLDEMSADHAVRLAEMTVEMSAQTSAIDQKVNSELERIESGLSREIDANRKGIQAAETQLKSEIESVDQQAKARDDSLSVSVQGTAHQSLTELSEISRKLQEVEQATVDFTQVIPKSLESVVTIGEKGLGYFNSAGAGVIVNNKGYIVTNHHVVDELQKITVKTHAGGEYAARLVNYDADLDIAIIRLETPRNDFDYLTFADSDEAFVGQHVIAIGNPVGFDSTVTEGIISNTKRIVTDDHDRQYLQTDVAVNKGNSGGPLIDKNGKIIGIVTLKYVDTGSEGLSFAIKSNDVSEAVFIMLQED